MARISDEARKVPTNLSAPAGLVRRARALELNLSEVFEVALGRAVDEAERNAWVAENEAAIDAYNAQIEKRGVFSDGWRKF